MTNPQFTLQRVAVGPEGAFGVLLADGLPFALTLERTYDAPTGQSVKIPAGRLRCKRSVYYKGGYPTYEIEVPGHTRILFHKGNWETDSEGCVLVGESFTELSGRPALGDSKGGFSEFMQRAGDAPDFLLEVRDPAAAVA